MTRTLLFLAVILVSVQSTASQGDERGTRDEAKAMALEAAEYLRTHKPEAGERGCEMTIATPGDHGQPQSIYQVLRHVYEAGAMIQEAVEAPRLRHDEGVEIMVEDRAPAIWSETLQAAGYAVRNVGSWSRLMGGVNAIQRLDHDLWGAGADPRRSRYAVAAGP
jgi:Gamma-glutamyltranspeptidase